MNEIVQSAVRLLREHPHPALRLGELLELVAERCDRTLGAGRLRALLEEHPHLFRVIDPWRGPWCATRPEASAVPSPGPWVVVVAEPDGDDPPPAAAAVRLRESVRWLSRDVDSRSTHEVSRWYAIVLAERAARKAIRRRAA